MTECKSTAITTKDRKKINEMTQVLEGLLAKFGIDSKALMEKRDEQMLPSIPKEFRDEAKSVLVKSAGVFALSNIGESHQDDLIEFEPFPCQLCGRVLGTECTYWIALGNMEYLRVRCPDCKTLVNPEGVPIEKTKRLNKKEPSIKKAMELAGMKDPEKVVDVEAQTEE